MTSDFSKVCWALRRRSQSISKFWKNLSIKNGLDFGRHDNRSQTRAAALLYPPSYICGRPVFQSIKLNVYYIVHFKKWSRNIFDFSLILLHPLLDRVTWSIAWLDPSRDSIHRVIRSIAGFNLVNRLIGISIFLGLESSHIKSYYCSILRTTIWCAWSWRLSYSIQPSRLFSNHDTAIIRNATFCLSDSIFATF